MAGTRACAVSRDAGTLRIDPYANGGTRGDERGYRPLADAERIRLAAAAPADAVGRAVLAALARATVEPHAPVT